MKHSCLRQTHAVAVLVTAIVVLQSCTSYYPRYTGGAPSREPHEVERYDKPQYVEGINVLGWTVNLAVAGGSAYAAYAYAPVEPTRGLLAKGGVSLSNDQVRAAHAVTAGLVTGLITFAINNGKDGRQPVVTAEDATRWLSDYNSRRKLVEFSRNDFIRSIPTDADERYVMRNLEDARFFAQLFPNSSQAEDVILRSLVNIPVSDQDDLVAIFPNLDISAKIKQQLVMDAATVPQWLTLNQQYPGVINQQDRELTSAKLRTIIKSFNDVKLIKQANPTYVSIDALQDLGMPYVRSLSDIAEFQSTFPQGSRDSSLYAIALQRIAGLNDAIEVKRMFDKSAADQRLDSLAYGVINAMQDVVLFKKEFPKSAQVALLPEKALQYVTSPQELIDYAKLFPGSDAIDERIQRFEPRISRDEALLLARNIPNTSRRSNLVDIYLAKSADLSSAIEASREYPGHEDMLAERVAPQLRKPNDYRLFLAAFGETAAAVEARGKYYELISQSPENLGTGVNTIYSEYGPKISPDGETLYFTRKDDPNGKGGYDIYVSVVDSDGHWQQAVNVGSPLNNESPNAVYGVSQDGRKLLIHNSYQGNGNIPSTTQIVGDGWSDPRDIDIQGFETLSKYHNGTLSADGQTIVMSIKQPDSYGGNDIYVIRQTDSGKWGTPLNAGLTINTNAEESSVSLAADGVTLYFSSEGHGGYGGADVFMSRRLDDSWTNWSEPINLGPTINTGSAERFYVIPASGDYVYYETSQNAIGASDIFRIGLPEAFRPKPVTLVTGRVLDQLSESPMAAEVLYEDLDTRETLGSVSTDPTTGEYKIILPSGRRYGFHAEVPNYFSVNQNVDLTEQANYKKLTNDLYVVPIKPGVSVPINNIFFETGKALLASSSSLELERLASILKAHPNVKIEVGGHTDNVGADESNMLLSKQRATAVTTFLQGSGVSAARMVSVGYGETKPSFPNDSDANRSRNRRVEFTVQ